MVVSHRATKKEQGRRKRRKMKKIMTMRRTAPGEVPPAPASLGFGV